MELNKQQINLIRLIERSEDIGQGWRKVSDTLWPHVTGQWKLPDDLCETREFDDQKQIRLTEKGQTVSFYLT